MHLQINTLVSDNARLIGENYPGICGTNAKETNESNIRNDVCFVLSGLVSSSRRIVVVFYLQVVTERGKQIYQFKLYKFVQLPRSNMISE